MPQAFSLTLAVAVLVVQCSLVSLNGRDKPAVNYLPDRTNTTSVSQSLFNVKELILVCIQHSELE